MASDSLSNLETKLDGFFHLAPPLPTDIKDLIVNYGPHLALVGGVLGILSSGILNYFIVGWTPKMLEFSIFNYYLQIIFNIIASVILLLSFKPLFNRQYHGWQMIFYLALLEVLLFIVALNIAGLFLLIIMFYLLFQVREKYGYEKI